MVASVFAQEASVSDLWLLDVLGIKDPIEKSERALREKEAREFLQTGVMPLLENHTSVSRNYDISRNRLTKTISRLETQGILTAYHNIFKQWEAEGIIERAPEVSVNKFCHYLRHSPVVKSYGSTKIRPVFDASAQKKGYPSLNQCLEVGPNLIDLVPSSLNRFRESKIGLVADIRKAFLQISVNKCDRDLLRFLWVINKEIVVFRHCRIVFGLACCPFILAAIIDLLLDTALNKVKGIKKVEWSEETVLKLKEAFYVDDCVTSVNSSDEMRTFIQEAKTVMATGGFDLHGWESSGDCSESTRTFVLGILWDKSKDTLAINPEVLKINSPDIITKRVILSADNRIFDPIGFTCPVSLSPKLLLQELWAEKMDWDTPIDNIRSNKLRQWLIELYRLDQIEIPRALGTGNLTLHAFGDTSGAAYAATVFARVEDGSAVRVQLLTARSRTAPKKSEIPRLELIAATIAVRLTNSVISSLKRKISQVTYWSDSTTVLTWIERDTQWNTFVQNRVKEIRFYSKENNWKYVPSENNPADLPSRSCNVSRLIDSEWWSGPQWLCKRRQSGRRYKET